MVMIVQFIGKYRVNTWLILGGITNCDNMTRNVVHILHVLRGDHISVLFSQVSLIVLPLNHCLAFIC